MTQEQVLKVLRDLQYRIDVSDPNDPEYMNAIRLRDRLCLKYGIDVASLKAKRIATHAFEVNTREEAQVIVQYAYQKLKRKSNEFNLFSHRPTRYAKKRFVAEIPMSDEEYEVHGRIIRELVTMFRRRRQEYLTKLHKELAKSLKAWDYQFLKAGDLLAKAEPGQKSKEPPWGLREAMAAADNLDGAIFPESYIAQQQKAISHAG